MADIKGIEPLGCSCCPLFGDSKRTFFPSTFFFFLTTTTTTSSIHHRSLDCLSFIVYLDWDTTVQCEYSAILSAIDHLLTVLDYRNSTLLSPAPETYWGQFEEISKYNVHLNLFERMWAAWYAYMQNDVLATGIMSFVMHEVVYFGRSLPWIIIDRMKYFNKYKIQSVSPRSQVSLSDLSVLYTDSV